MKTKIMYMELKTHGGGHDDRGEARIGRVMFSKSMKSLHYNGRTFHRARLGCCGNYVDAESEDVYWISGAKKDGTDRYYWGKSAPVLIDKDVREEYWTTIREQPSRIQETMA